MTLVDANLLLYAADETSARHDAARTWPESTFASAQRVGIPWMSIGAFLRVATNPRASPTPTPPETAWAIVAGWLAAPNAWTPTPGPGYATILGNLVLRHRLTGNLVPDAQLAALAIEHGLTLYSADGDFARFDELAWRNPLR